MAMSVDPATDLRARVKAAVREYVTVVQFHESWRIAAHDKALHGRVSHSFAGQTFLIVRRALRREMLLGLTRLWDHRTEAIKIISIADDLENPTILDSLLPNTPIYAEARGQAAEAAALIRRYEKGGSSHSALSRLRKLRNQHLAHHQIDAKLPIGVVEEEEIEKHAEDLYADSAKLISLLEHVVERTEYDPKETAGVYEFYAKFFWDAVTGERNEGHPRRRIAEQSHG
jgi:AbiU2